MPKKIWTTGDIPSQTGKIALVTGGTGGLGYETAFALAGAGATVIIAGRNEEKGRIALEKIWGIYPDAKIEFGNVDLSSLESISEFSNNISTKYANLDILVNNAGVMVPPKRTVTKDGFEIQFGTNYLSHFALTAHLLPLLKQSTCSRVVNVSSVAHRNGRINFDDLQSEKCKYNWSVYAQSKIAMLMFAFEFQRRSIAGGWGITGIGAHPGYARTDLITNGPGEGGIVWWFNSHVIGKFVSHSAANGALPQLYAATSPEAQGGGYYGPDGFYGLKGDVGPAFISARAKDTVVAAKLWDISVSLTGVTWP